MTLSEYILHLAEQIETATIYLQAHGDIQIVGQYDHDPKIDIEYDVESNSCVVL